MPFRMMPLVKAVFALVALSFLVTLIFAMEGPDKMVRRGGYLFNTLKPSCSSCHTPKQNSLDDYGSRGSEREARDWIRRPSRQFEKTGKRGMMPAYKLPDEDVEALVQYLLTLEE